MWAKSQSLPLLPGADSLPGSLNWQGKGPPPSVLTPVEFRSSRENWIKKRAQTPLKNLDRLCLAYVMSNLWGNQGDKAGLRIEDEGKEAKQPRMELDLWL